MLIYAITYGSYGTSLAILYNHYSEIGLFLVLNILSQANFELIYDPRAC
jgi:hypothetical protein